MDPTQATRTEGPDEVGGTEEVGDRVGADGLEGRRAPGLRDLRTGEVHVWTVPLRATPDAARRLTSILSDDERARAGRLRRPHLRPRFVVGRARQREILASYLGVEPAALRFVRGEHGKPALAAPLAATGLCFNASDSADLGLLALAAGREVGVDLERVRPMDDFERLARRFFAPEEAAALARLPTSQRLEAFFRCWTRKEAVLKAMGTGLARSLDRVIVSLGPDEPARVRSVDGDEGASRSWWLSALSPAEGFVGAVAGPGDTPRLRTWQHPGPGGGAG